MADTIDTGDRSLPRRTLLAALALGAAGWASAATVAAILASIAAPSFDRYVRPAKFAYGTPPGWSGGSIYAWVIAVPCALALPLLFNRSWISRRLLSPAGIVKLLLAS